MVFLNKKIIEDLEANLTGTSIDASNPDDLVLAEEGNSNESITVVAKASNDMEIYLEE